MSEQPRATESHQIGSREPLIKGAPTTAEIPFIYPAHWEADVVLRDGATAHLRPVIPTDRNALQQMYAGQSERTIYLRFFAPKPQLSEKELTRFTTVDHKDRVAFVLMLGDEMIGIGRFDRTDEPTEAEVAFMISDRHQGRGIGSILLEHLAAAAKELGINKFAAEVLPQNRAMLNVFADTGYDVSRAFDDGFVMVRFDIDPTDRSRQVMESREHRAEAKSISELLNPASIAVVGSSSTWSDQAQPMIETIRQGGFQGKIWGVCLEGGAISDSTGESPNIVTSVNQTEGVELALITVPIEQVERVVESCGRAGIRGALILTRGYAEDGTRGQVRQKALVRTARSFGMRIIGPASFGILNNSPEINLDATVNQHDPQAGTLGVFTQSAVMGEMFSNMAVRRRIGVSSLVSAGNRADVSGNDLMQYWEDDPGTSVCALYLESIGNPRKFSRIARRLSRNKPVIVAKNAVTGMQLPPGHAGRTSIAPATALESLFKQSGVISADSSEQVLDIAQLLVSMPLPSGRRLAVVSNATALAQMVADRANTQEIEVKLADAALDLEHEDSAFVQQMLRTAAESSDVDALMVVFMHEDARVCREIASLAQHVAEEITKPILAVFPGIIENAASMVGLVQDSTIEHPGLPCYASPMGAVDSLAAVMNYVEWREKEGGTYATPSGVSPDTAAHLIADFMPRVQGENLLPLAQEDVASLLEAYGIELLPSTTVDSPQEAVDRVEELGSYPVVLKSTDETLSKRLDLGGVRLGIENAEQLRAEFETMKKRLARYGKQEIELQKQAEAGQSAVMEAIEDPLLGPVISFGMSGDTTALLGDWAYRIPPLTKRDVEKLIRSPKAAAKLFGDDDLPEVRVDLLEDLATRVALMKDNHPEIASLQLSPVIVSETTLTVARAKITLGNPRQRTDSARRSLSA